MVNSINLIRQSWSCYRRFYRLVAGAVILLMSVLAGSLLLGDSVRGTLVQRVSERLGRTESLIASGTGFMSEDILREPLLDRAQGYLLMDGFISLDGKLIPVYVWGTDADSLSDGQALLNEPLQRKIGEAEDVVLHLPSHSLVPSGSLFVTQSYATQMRLQVVGTKSVDEGGNLLLKNEQTLPFNVFISRQQLAEEMELQGKVNIILSEKALSEQQLADIWQPAYSGIHLTDSSLTYDGIFIPEDVVDGIMNNGDRPVNNGVRPHYSLYFSYLVNDIIHAQDTVPYSFVTAVTEWQGETLTGHDIILSDYAAAHLMVDRGDTVRMSYFLAQDLKNLETREQLFCVKYIVPLSDFQQDSLLMAEFPGLSNVERCADWDSDLPIKMDHIHKVDEDFWYQYHQTPKALVAYDAVQGDWANSFGSATALRIPADKVSSTQKSLRSQSFLTLVSPRGQAIESASSGVDFASLFMALGFFIILSAILLMQNPLLEMFHLRRDELLLYRQIGYSRKRLMSILFREAFSVIFLASPLGVLLGLLYSEVTLWLLSNVWSGATHTEGFALHVNALSLLLGWVAGLVICALSLYFVIRKTLQEKAESQRTSLSSHLSPLTPHLSCLISHLSPLCLLLTLILIVYNFLVLHSMVLFIVCGLLWIVSFGLLLREFIQHRVDGRPDKGWNRRQLMYQSIHASMRQHLVAYWALSLGVFTVFAVGLNRPDFSDEENVRLATGGYQYYVDSRVPIQYDLNNAAVRQKLSLTHLPDSTVFLPFLRHTLDEASCLNLNKVTTPTVLGADLNKMASFGLTSTSTPSYSPSGVGAAVYLDEEALIWSLMKSVGDTLYYNTSLGEHTPVLIAGTYPTGLFHGSAIMSREDFRRLWPNESGVEVLLMRSSQPDEAAEVLSLALNEYGLTLQTVEERLQMFFEVTETYLIIFLTLGGLGLLLGIFSLFIIVRKNLTAGQTTIQQYRALGFSHALIRQLLLRENLVTPLYAILVGTVGSVISISANVTGAGLSTILLALICVLLLSVSVYYGVKFIIDNKPNEYNCI